MFCSNRPNCELCRFRKAAEDSRWCPWCSESMERVPRELRSSILRYFRMASPKDISDFLRWMITILPTDQEMVQVLAGRVTIASWCAGEAAKALENAARKILDFAGFVGDDPREIGEPVSQEEYNKGKVDRG